MMRADSPCAVVEYFSDAIDGPGWYYYDEEYQEEGVVGAFSTREEAVSRAMGDGYEITPHAHSGGGQ